MRLGIYGGSFDPVHLGHLLLAETCREHCGLDQVWFVPACTPPHKQSESLSSPRQRIEMLRLAIAGHPAFDVSEMEAERGGVSYTADSLAAVAEQHPNAKLFFLMGADSLIDLPNWRNPQTICQLAIPVVIGRPDNPPPDLSLLTNLVSPERLLEIEAHKIDAPLIEISSSDIRQRIALGESIRFRTPRAVEQYIESNQMYRGG